MPKRDCELSKMCIYSGKAIEHLDWLVVRTKYSTE